jgi:hypothetical protein
VWDLFLKQDRRCALSGVVLCFCPTRKEKHLTTASLDRINSNDGYIAGNVQWIHKDLNKMKSDFSEDRFIELCGLVSTHKGRG